MAERMLSAKRTHSSSSHGLTHTDPTLNAGNYPDLTAVVTPG
ncbi:hypothetical protein PANPA_00302 (plasmid) [Pantoea sp. Nvir]